MDTLSPGKVQFCYLKFFFGARDIITSNLAPNKHIVHRIEIGVEGGHRRGPWCWNIFSHYNVVGEFSYLVRIKLVYYFSIPAWISMSFLHRISFYGQFLRFLTYYIISSCQKVSYFNNYKVHSSKNFGTPHAMYYIFMHFKNPEQISLESLFKMQPQAQSCMIGKQNINSQKTSTCPTSAAFWNFVEISLTISHSVCKNKGRLQYFLLLDNIKPSEMKCPNLF